MYVDSLVRNIHLLIKNYSKLHLSAGKNKQITLYLSFLGRSPPENYSLYICNLKASKIRMGQNLRILKLKPDNNFNLLRPQVKIAL